MNGVTNIPTEAPVLFVIDKAQPLSHADFAKLYKVIRQLTPSHGRRPLKILNFADDAETVIHAKLSSAWLGPTELVWGGEQLACHRSEIANLCNQAVETLREVWSLTVQHRWPDQTQRFSRYWWYSKLSEKNTPLDGTWSAIARALVIKKHLQAQSYAHVVLYCTQDIYRAVLAPIRQHAHTVVIFKAKREKLLRLACMRLIMLFRMSRLIRAARAHERGLAPKETPALLFSWPEFWRQRFGRWEDVYYGGDFIQAWQASVPQTRLLFSISGKAYFSCGEVKAQIDRLKGPQWTPESFSVIEGYGSYRQLFRCYLSATGLLLYLKLKQTEAYRKSWVFESINLQPLFQDMLWETVLLRWPHLETLQAMTQSAITKLNPKQVLMYPFEYLGGRAILQGIRAASCNPMVVGLQHGPMAPLKLLYTGKPSERISSTSAPCALPEPDRYCVDGPLSKELLCKRGIPPGNIYVIGAPRLDPVWRRALSQPKPKSPTIQTILAAPGLHDTATVVSFVQQASMRLKTLRFIIKVHPKVDVSKVEEQLAKAALQNPQLKKQIEIVGSGEIYDWFEKADALVGTYSSTAIEAMAFNLPVVLLRSQNWLDLSPFTERYTDIRSAGTVDELCSHLQQLADPQTLERYLAYQTEALHYVFEQPDGHAFERMVKACVTRKPLKHSNAFSPAAAGVS